jgi:hypothetical protein
MGEGLVNSLFLFVGAATDDTRIDICECWHVC